MELNKLASIVAKREGKKSQVKIGDVREVLKILVELEAESVKMQVSALHDQVLDVKPGQVTEALFKAVAKYFEKKKDKVKSQAKKKK